MKEKQQTLPEKSYERSMNHNYMILCTYDFFEQTEEKEDYAARMILENKIPGLLPVMCRRNTGQRQYCYEINSLQPLDRLYEKQEIGYEPLHSLLIGMVRIFERLEEYLLDGTQIILEPEYIYLSIETGEPFLVCYPDYQGDIRESFRALMDYLLARTDHTQEAAVWLSYQVYRYTRNPNYALGRLKELVFESEEIGLCRSGNTQATVPMMKDTPQKDIVKAARITMEEMEGIEGIEEIEAEEDEGDEEDTAQQKKHGNMTAGAICMLLAFLTGAVLCGVKFFHLFTLSLKQEAGLCGIAAMLLVSSVLFLVSGRKQRRRGAETFEEDVCLRPETGVLNRPVVKEAKTEVLNSPKQLASVGYTTSLAGETAVLNEVHEQHRYLKGTVNGEEMRIELERFPLTLGKLAEFSDVTIPDRTVSRMHARLEERDGNIYLLDLNSTNGTKRNGRTVNMNEEVALEPGDKLAFGGVSFTYCG